MYKPQGIVKLLFPCLKSRKKKRKKIKKHRRRHTSTSSSSEETDSEVEVIRESERRRRKEKETVVGELASRDSEHKEDQDTPAESLTVNNL